MTHLLPTRPTLVTLLFVALITTLLVTGCDNSPTSCPTYAIGSLEGYVTSVGEGIAAEVNVKSYTGKYFDKFRYETTSDSTGWYHLDLPSGLYVVHAEYHRVSLNAYDNLDTVRITNQVHRYDIRQGRAEIVVTVPEELENDNFNLKLVGDRFQLGFLEETGEGGELLFVSPAPPPGDYRLKISSRSANQFYLPGTVLRDEATTITIGPDEVVHHAFDLIDSHVSISGTTTGCEQGSYLGSLGINVLGADGLTLAGDHVFSSGEFRCDFFVPGSVRLQTEYQGITQWVGGDSFDTAQEFDLQAGDHLSDVSIPGSGIGVHLEGPGLLLSHDASVILRPESGPDLNPYVEEGSSFTFCNLQPGRYFLYVDDYCFDQVWAPQWYGGSETFEGAQPIDLADGEFLDLTFNLIEGGRVEGGIIDSNGDIYRQVSYQLANPEEAIPCTYFLHSEDGRIRFQGLADGSYRLTARFLEYSNWYYPGTWDYSEAEYITISDHELLTITDWVLPEVLRKDQP